MRTTPRRRSVSHTFKVRRQLFARGIHQLRAAIRPQKHDDAAALHEWDANPDEAQREHATTLLKEMLERSTGSINNTYLKIQIGVGLVVALMAFYLTVLRAQAGVQADWLNLGVLLNATGIAVSLLVTTPRSAAWLQTVNTPGVYAMRQTPRDEYLTLSKRAFHNRVVLLGNRRLSWLAMWVFTLPGLAVAMAGWAPVGTAITIMLVLSCGRLYHRITGGGRPPGWLSYPYV